MRRISSTPNKIDIGCGNSAKAGFAGIDVIDHGQEIVWDVTHGIPLPDNSIDAVYSSHFIEHIPDHEMSALFDDIIRVCKNGATVELRCPHADTIEGNYPCHVSRWNELRMRGLGVNYQIRELYRDGIELVAKITITK